MNDDLTNVETELPGLMGGISESAVPTPAPHLDFSSLYGDAPYEGREEAPAEPAPVQPAARRESAVAEPNEEARQLRARVDYLEGYLRQGQEAAEEQRQQYTRAQQEAANNQAAYQRAVQMAALPEVNPDELLADPKKFTAYSQGLVQRAVQATMAMLEPAINENRALRAEQRANLRRAQEGAMDLAAPLIEKLGYDAETEFSVEERRAVAKRLRELGPDGELMLADPKQIVNAWVLGRVESGGSLAPKRAPKAPSAAPTNGSRAPRGGKVPLARLPIAAQQMFRMLRVPGGDLDHNELESLRAAGIG